MRLARQGWPLVAATTVPALGAALLGPLWLSGPLIGLALFTTWFFRDPERAVPSEAGLIVAPADGRVLSVEEVLEPRHLNERMLKVSIFMSPLDVHVNRVPLGGEVLSVRHERGRFFNAAAERASLMNENNAVVLKAGGRRLLCVQVAGFLARRIRCWVAPGQKVATGQRFGLIQFGSRVDLYLPLGTRVAVKPGQRTRAGETVIGCISGRLGEAGG